MPETVIVALFGIVAVFIIYVVANQYFSDIKPSFTIDRASLSTGAARRGSYIQLGPFTSLVV